MATGRYHWSNCAHSAKFFKVNAMGSIPVLALILHPSWASLWFLIGLNALLVWVEIFKKMSVREYIRSINIKLTGRVKSSLNLIHELVR
jgi:hypothetical protein